MVRIRFFVILLVLSFISVGAVMADVAMHLQLPFVEGEKFECTQNSDDFPSHNITSTKYDLDFGLDTGTLLTAAADGIAYPVKDPTGGFGNYIKIDHGNGYWTMYGHMMNNGFIVQSGQRVIAGQPIGFSGATGDKKSTGPHLHFGVHSGGGQGASQRMKLRVVEYNNDNRIGEFDYVTGNDNETDFYCKNEKGLGNEGNSYQAKYFHDVDFHCHQLDNKKGILCWNESQFCDDGFNHTRYYTEVGKGFQSESVMLDTKEKYEAMCFPQTGDPINLFGYLEGTNGTGGGSPLDPERCELELDADPFLNDKEIDIKTGDTTLPAGFTLRWRAQLEMDHEDAEACKTDEAQDHETIETDFFMSIDGGDWQRKCHEKTHFTSLEENKEKAEYCNITLPTEPNTLVAFQTCTDVDNELIGTPDGGTCSRIEEFRIIPANEYFHIDLVAEGFTFLKEPKYALGEARFGAYIANILDETPISGIRSSYEVECPGTGRIRLADDGTDAQYLTPGAYNWEETASSVFMPDVVGNCTAFFCVDYLKQVPETDENNCFSFDFTLQPTPKPKLRVTSMRDRKGCCTTNRGEYVYPKIWVKNEGPARPAANVPVIYYIEGSATGGSWVHIGWGYIRPDELDPGETDEDQMDGRWRIPKSSPWKKKWHYIHGCVNPEGGAPYPLSENHKNSCGTYYRYSKK